MKKSFINKYLFVILLMFISSTFFVQKTYSYFDLLKKQEKGGEITIGDWVLDPEEIKDYIETKHNDKSNHILDLIGTVGSNGSLDLDPIFEVYTQRELEEVVELIDEFIDNFMYFKNGTFEYLKAKDSASTQISNVNFLKPGESQLMKQVIQTVNHPSTKWKDLTIQISMELPGQDISDFALEFIYDSAPFRPTNPFQSYYRLIDNRNTRFEYGVSNISIIPINDNISYNSLVNKYRNSTYQPVLYKHNFSKPSTTGNWSRLSSAPNYYLSTPISSRQEFVLGSPQQSDGLILKGRADGSKVEMRFSFLNGMSVDGKYMPLIPAAIVLTRGLELGSDGVVLPNQSTTEVVPIIKIKVVEGTVYEDRNL